MTGRSQVSGHFLSDQGSCYFHKSTMRNVLSGLCSFRTSITKVASKYFWASGHGRSARGCGLARWLSQITGQLINLVFFSILCVVSVVRLEGRGNIIVPRGYPILYHIADRFVTDCWIVCWGFTSCG